MIVMSLADAIDSRICCTLTILCLASVPVVAAGQEKIEVDARWAAGTSVTSEAVLRLEPDRAAEPQATAIEVPFPVPSRAEVSLPVPGVWRARLLCEGYWGEEKEVVVAPSAMPAVSLRLFPAAQIQGTLILPVTSTAPISVDVDFVETPRYGPLNAESIPEGSETCEVTGSQVACTVPTGQLDLRLHSPGFASVYLWGVEVDPDETHPIGALRLVEGGSVIGWIQDEDGRPLEDITVELAAAVARELSDPILTRRLQRQRFEAKTNERGFFQITGIVPGTYRISAAGEGFAAARPEELITVAGTGEERIESPIIMMPPAIFEIALEPPLDPSGKPWDVEIFQLGEGHYVDKQIRGMASSAGVWRQVGLEPGVYFLQIFDSAGSRWVGEEVRVDALTPLLVIEIPVVEVVGTVTRDGEAVPGDLSLTCERSTVRFKVGDEGEFAGLLPDEKQFGVILAPDELSEQGTSLVLEPVELERREGRKAVLDIEVPNTRIEGNVVDNDGRPVRGARVRLMASGARQQHSFTKTDEEGAFAFWGIPPGDVLVGAKSGTEESEKVLAHVEEDMVPPRLRLQLLGNMRISGQVITSGGPLAGAQVLSWPDMGSSHSVSFKDTGTDIDGTFELDVRTTARWINFLVRSPGFATRLLSEPASPERPVMIIMDKDGGDVILELPAAPASPETGSGVSPRQMTPLLSHEGVSIPVSFFRTLSPTVRRNEATLGRMILHNLESGEYSLCIGSQAFTSFRQGTQTPVSQCVSGFLSPGGVLQLSLSEPAEDPG